MNTIPLLTLVTLFGLCSLSPARDFKTTVLAEKATVKNIGVEEFDKLRADKGAVVLDVRTPKEFAAGHMAGATNIDWNAADFAGKVAALDKSKVYLVHCAAGGRSAKAAAKMNTMDFSKVYNLEGGFNAWQKAGKPVER